VAYHHTSCGSKQFFQEDGQHFPNPFPIFPNCFQRCEVPSIPNQFRFIEFIDVKFRLQAEIIVVLTLGSHTGIVRS
jgi:hypothetical protein